ncbi:MAG: hypothetical protein ACNA8J_01295 [Gammaproteobacteria bacterium]
MEHQAPDKRARRARVIRNAIILGITAFAIYLVFIMLVAERGPGAL